jgi:hypothetical protein
MVQFPLVLLLKVVITEEKLPNVPLVSREARVDRSELLLMRSVRVLPFCARAEAANKAAAKTEDLMNMDSLEKG